MIRKIYILLVFVSLGLFSFGQKKDYRVFIPKQYDTLPGGRVQGDLNKDGNDDIALALYHNKENEQSDNFNEDSIPARKLIVLFGSKEGYKKIIESSSTLLCKYCGGVFGDPFAGLEISKNILTIWHYGGSAWRWGFTHKFRYQNNAFFLIGKTSNTYWNVETCEELKDFAGTDYEDINFITGQYERKKISEDCKLVENKKGKRKVQPLVSLAKFNIEN